MRWPLAKRRGKHLGGRRRKIIGKDAKGKPIYGDVVHGSAKARAKAVAVVQQHADARASDIAPTIKALQEAGHISLRAIAAVLNVGLHSVQHVGSALGPLCR